MKYQHPKYPVRGSWLFCLILIFCFPVFGQKNAIEGGASPSGETFRPASDLISPWVNSGCSHLNLDLRQKDCYLVTPQQWGDNRYLTIYDSDGSVWYGFDLNDLREEVNAGNKIKKNFEPLVTFIYQFNIVLRLVAESDNWYEVEINEKSRETKYISKNDPHWTKTKWEQWLSNIERLHPPPDPTPLLDKPDGKPIPESAGIDFWYYRTQKIEGDWVYVEGKEKSGPSEEKYFGWLRWRKGRDILLGCYFNNYYGVIGPPDLNASR